MWGRFSLGSPLPSRRWTLRCRRCVICVPPSRGRLSSDLGGGLLVLTVPHLRDSGQEQSCERLGYTRRCGKCRAGLDRGAGELPSVRSCVETVDGDSPSRG